MKIRKFNESSDDIKDKLRDLFVEFIDNGIVPEINIFADTSRKSRRSTLAPISITLAGTYHINNSTIMEMLIDVKSKIINTLDLIESGGGIDMSIYATDKTFINIKINLDYKD